MLNRTIALLVTTIAIGCDGLVDSGSEGEAEAEAEGEAEGEAEAEAEGEAEGEGDPDLTCGNPLPEWQVAWAEFENEVLDLVNLNRSNGWDCDAGGNFGPTGPLEMDHALRCASRAHSMDMGENNFFSHVGSGGSTFDERMNDWGFTGGFPQGENIAAGQATPSSVVAGWMESDGHCSNIMAPDFDLIGVGYFYDTDGNGYGHYWTMDLGGH